MKPKSITKSKLFATLAAQSGLSVKDVRAVLTALRATMAKELGPDGPGVFILPDLMKITRQRVEAKPARKNVKNPFTGELVDRPAKPAYNKAKFKALKLLKDMIDVPNAS